MRPFTALLCVLGLLFAMIANGQQITPGPVDATARNGLLSKVGTNHTGNVIINGTLTVTSNMTGNASSATYATSSGTASNALTYTGTNYFAYVNSSNYVWTTYADTLLSNLWLITVINGVNVNTNTLPNR